VWDECRDNLAYFHEAGNKAAAAEAIAKADLVIKHQMRINRLTTVSMEPRGCLAEYDPRDERYTLRCTVQGPHQVRRTWRRTCSAFPSRIRVISDNVGGGFGMKGGLYPEYALATLAAKLTGRPVKWIGDRSESFLADEHCRDNVTEAELALDKNGKFLAIRVKNYCNLGAYNASDRSGGPPTNNIGVLAGTYTFPAGYVEVNGTFTNTMLPAIAAPAG
jgi:carbon-monoxide dehydrogenase large subunit